MSKIVHIYKNGDYTVMETTINGKKTTQSSDKGRSLEVIDGGVKILPDPEEKIWNNFKILISELQDDFGATNGTELLNALLTRNFFKKGGGGVLGGELSETITATLNLGGISIGNSFEKNTKIDSVLKSLISPYVAPAFTSFSIIKTNNPASAVIGESVEIQQAAFNYNLGSDRDNPTNVRINGEVFNLDVANGVKTHVLNPFQSISKTIPTTVTWTLVGFDKNNNAIASRTSTFTWFHQFLFGASSLEIDNGNFQALLTALSQKKKVNSNSSSFTCASENEDVNNYTYLAFADAYNDLSSIIFNGSAPILGAFTKIGVFNWVNAFGVTIPTKVYRSNSKGAFANNDTLNAS